jgi:hypothetical protein
MMATSRRPGTPGRAAPEQVIVLAFQSVTASAEAGLATPIVMPMTNAAKLRSLAMIVSSSRIVFERSEMDFAPTTGRRRSR